MKAALLKIAGHPRGGLIVAGSHGADRDELVGIARSVPLIMAEIKNDQNRN